MMMSLLNGLLGLVSLLGLLYLLSENRKRIAWRTVLPALGLQLTLRTGPVSYAQAAAGAGAGASAGDPAVSGGAHSGAGRQHRPGPAYQHPAGSSGAAPAGAAAGSKGAAAVSATTGAGGASAGSD